MQNKGLIFLLFCASITIWGQETPETSILDIRENIHLHLNKTTFLQGERLWLKAYILDQNTKLPSLATTNLHVGIYNDGGKEVKRKLFYVENGMAQGDFAIDSILTDNEYTVLAWTNYMRNFKELEPFRQRIKILRDGMEEKTGEVEMKISIYPEGGQLIAGAYNNMGVLVDNGLGQGVQVDNLELVDESGNVIRSNVKTNRLGMGKTGFLVQAKESYFLQRQRPDGSMVRVKVPEAADNQLGMSIDNNGKDKILLTLLASKETFSQKDGAIHTIALYQDDFIRLEDIEVNKDEPVLSIDREELPFGVLTAVLFDTELHPVAHRVFFNHREDADIIHDLEIEHCLTEFGDSLQVDLIVSRGIEQDTKVSLSALPAESQAYGADHSIASSFLVRPYVNTSFQDRYFFEGMDRKKRYELDLRLLIEGWGKYDWDSRKQKELEMAYVMETGISFEGRIMDADLNEENQVSLIAVLSSAMAFEELDENKSFNANMQLFQGDSLGISLISKRGKLRKSEVELSFQNQNSPKEPHEWLIGQNVTKRQLADNVQDNVDQIINIGERTIALEEVTVTESKLRDNKYQLTPKIEGRLVGDIEINRYGSVTSYLQRLGFIIDGSEGEIIILSPSFPHKVVSVSLNGMGAMPGEIIGMPLSSVRFITWSKDREYPWISIVGNPNYVPPNQRNKFIKFAIEKGYARPQDYFTPNYPDYNSRVFKNYAALDWKANISVGAELPTSITIPIKTQEAIQLYVEGMDADGKLVAQQKSIELE